MDRTHGTESTDQGDVTDVGLHAAGVKPALDHVARPSRRAAGRGPLKVLSVHPSPVWMYVLEEGSERAGWIEMHQEDLMSCLNEHVRQTARERAEAASQSDVVDRAGTLYATSHHGDEHSPA